MISTVKRLLAHPATRDLTIDDPRTTERRRGIIEGNRFLWRIYDEWYARLAESIPAGPGRIVELGSGAGFLKKYLPDAIASEVFVCPTADIVLDARAMPFREGSLKSVLMVDVLHHIPDTREFFANARECLRPGGTIAMIEPWVSGWSRIIYTNLHHEPFLPEAPEWRFPDAGPLSGANGAVPWMILQRDRSTFDRDFPEFEVRTIELMMPFRYLVSGGVSMRPLMPEWSYTAWRWFDRWLVNGSRAQNWAMFAFILLSKR